MNDGSSSAFKQSAATLSNFGGGHTTAKFWSRTYKVRDMHCLQLIRENVQQCSLPGVTLVASSVCTRKSVHTSVLSMYVCMGWVYTKCVHIR